MCYKRTTCFINYAYNGSLTRFKAYCDAVNVNIFPINKFRETLNGQELDTSYYDAATDAFKLFVSNEYICGR